MRKLARLLAGLAIFAFFVIAAGRAADQEFASAGGALSRGEARSGGPASTGAASPSESTYQGKAAVLRAIRLVFRLRAAPAIRVAYCETGGTFNTRAVGRAGERGIFQIHPIHFSWVNEARLFDPVYNSRIAYRLSRGGTTWRAWTCKP